MSTAVLSPRMQPLVAWLLLLLVLLAIGLFGILPAIQHSLGLGEQIEAGYKRLDKMRQVALATPQLNAEYERVRQQGLDQLFYPAGMTSAQVAKELQNQVTAVVGRRSGLLLSSEVLEQTAQTPDTTSGYQRVTVQAVFQGSTELLRDVLHEAYASRPLLFVEALEVKPLEGTTQQQIRGTVKISTYWRGGAV